MEYLITCQDCNGKGERNYCYFNSKTRTKVEKLNTCKTCRGKGTVVKKKSYFLHELLKTKRQIDYYWKILKHQISIPNEYLYDSTETCSNCGGSGSINNKIISEDGKTTITKYVKCDNCNGKGIVNIKSIREIYDEIFNNYLNAKKYKKELFNILDEQEWKNPEYKEYREYLPDKSMEVCIRCSKYLDGTDGMGGADSCCGCVNESMCNENGYSYFTPINEKAREWYNKGGYKCNLCYDRNHDYKI